MVTLLMRLQIFNVFHFELIPLRRIPCKKKIFVLFKKNLIPPLPVFTQWNLVHITKPSCLFHMCFNTVYYSYTQVYVSQVSSEFLPKFFHIFLINNMHTKYSTQLIVFDFISFTKAVPWVRQ
jgi:hypothetical protein